MTKNSERTIVDCLWALRKFDEVLVLDNGSCDRTVDIVSTMPGVRLLQREPDRIMHFGRVRNWFSKQASNDWLLMVDSDEILSEAVIREIMDLDLDSNTVYGISRVNHYRGRPIKGCGLFPDYCNRLYDRRVVEWKDRQVHEVLLVPSGVRVQNLKGTLDHFSCEGAAQQMRKLIHYAELFAESNAGKRDASVFSAIMHGGWMFFRNYVLKRGFIYGRDGIAICWAQACGSYYKYLLLTEANDRLKHVPQVVPSKAERSRIRVEVSKP